MSFWDRVQTIDQLDEWLRLHKCCLLESGWTVTDGEKPDFTVTLAPNAHGHPIHRVLGVTQAEYLGDTTRDHVHGSGVSLREALYRAMHTVEALVARANGEPEPPAPAGAA